MAEKENEFDRPGSVRVDEYIKGLKAELAAATTDEDRKAVKAELDRVSKIQSTAVAAKAEETA